MILGYCDLLARPSGEGESKPGGAERIRLSKVGVFPSTFLWAAWMGPARFVVGARRIEELDRFGDHLGHPPFLSALALVAASPVPSAHEHPPASAEEIAACLGEAIERDHCVGFHMLLHLLVAVFPLLVHEDAKTCSGCPVCLAVLCFGVGRQTADKLRRVIIAAVIRTIRWPFWPGYGSNSASPADGSWLSEPG